MILDTCEALLPLNGQASLGKNVALISEILPQIEAVLKSSNLSYRDALVVQFAFWLANGRPTDITQRQEGGRGVAGWLGKYLASKHIRAVSDAFQNIGKNTENLVRGNFAEFDSILR